MAKQLTRKELKSDKFALEVKQSVEYVAEHRKQFIRWGSVAGAVLVIVVSVIVYRNHQHSVRQEALHAALELQNASIGPENPNVSTFPTQTARDQAVNKAFSDLAAKYHGTREGAMGEFFLGTNAADKGNLAEAEKHFKLAVDSIGEPFASVGKLSLAQTYAAEGKLADGEKLIQSVIDKPTVLVSKEEATIVLAQVIADKDPERARKLLEPLRSSQRPNVSKAALTIDSNLPKK